MAGLESQGIASHGPMPAGMLRIRHGSQERYIWPVHLSGWLAMGWRVAGAGAEAPSIGVAAAEPPAPAAVLDLGPAAESPSEPAPTRGRRGRRRKDEATASAAAEPSTEQAWRAEPGINPDKGEPRADSDAASGELGNQSDPNAVAGSDESTADSAATDTAAAPTEPSPDPEDALTALPDDLFNDPLI